ncbi:disease resistance protein RUN1-like [Lotus japonicus]|uniref:disease resistance protein RUN1-like n=1 Tax=Lotus japonicus TaxID=34305 RepID=UPI0025864E37|nr:disease resistance protein RUN1-like [Lotus japonicus]
MVGKLLSPKQPIYLDGDDSQVIENIVKSIWGKLRSMQYDYEEGLVGVEEQCGAIEGLSGKIGRLGLWGMGGIGKTTIAKALFANHSPKYDSACFLQNIREESQMHGLTHIHDQLLSELLKEQVTTSNFSESSLNSRKVLIVLDDVDSSEQIESLWVGLGELGEGSSLIVTTRDKHLLHGTVDEIHELKPWNFEKSLVLFCLGAFKKSEPDNAFEDLSKRAVECAAGLPFVLRFLGSHFYSKNIEFWKTDLIYFRSKFFKEILDVLKVSYYGLSRQEQAIFLDIAFFFKDRNQDSVISILDASGFNAASGIEKLKDKALITISKRNTIQMIDLLQDMAFDIVRHDATDPRRGSILRDSEEVRAVLVNGKETPDVVEGALLNLSENAIDSYQICQFDAGIFNLPKLRIIRFYSPLYISASRYYSFRPDLNNEGGSAELKYFEWTEYPSKSLPTNFCVRFLVEIRMQYSKVEELWDGTQELVNLETIDMCGSKYLQRLPDLSKALKLKWVYLSGCKRLRYIHSSLLSVDTLVTLALDRCYNLESVICDKHLSYLENLNLYYCCRLKKFSVSSDSFKRLNLSCTGIKKLYTSISRLSKLEWLNLSDCYQLSELPDDIGALSSLRALSLDECIVEKLPTSIKLLEKLEILSLKNCKKLRSLPELPLLIKELNTDGCTLLVTISALKTFSVKMKGMKKHISFLNAKGLMNESLLLQIMEDVVFAMKRAELCNIFVRSSVTACFSGSSVPSLPGSSFVYRSTGSSITIEPPPHDDGRLSHNCLGTIYSVVLSPSRWASESVEIQCRFYGKDGEYINTTSYGKEIRNNRLWDNVFLWQSSSFKGAQVFEFVVTIDSGATIDDDYSKIKECGIDLMFCSDSELQSLTREAELEPEIKGVALDLRENNWKPEGAYYSSDSPTIIQKFFRNGNCCW